VSVLVFGKNGQLARELSLAVAGRGDEWRFVGSGEADLRVPGAAGALVRTSAPALVVNAAAFTDVDGAESRSDEAFRINGTAAGEIANATAEVGAGLIHVSTDYVFDGSARKPIAEDAPVNPLGAYGRSKWKGEEAVRSANGRHAIIRTSWLVSPFGHNFLKTMLRLAKERDEIGVVDDQVGRPTVAADLAAAVVAIHDRWSDVEPDTYHLAGGGEPGSWADLAEEIMGASVKAGGDSAQIRPIASFYYPTPARRPAYSVLDCSRAERRLGITLSNWRQSVARTVERVLRSPQP
jgi:dTDP-4-dehydrorhamnose reductase